MLAGGKSLPLPSGIFAKFASVLQRYRLNGRTRLPFLIGGALVSVGIGLFIAFAGMAAELAIFLALTFVARQRLSSWLRLKRGRLEGRYWLETLGLGAAFGQGGVLLLHLAPPLHFVGFARPSMPALVIGIAGLAVMNAVVEEALWRVLLYGLLEDRLPTLAAVVLQAVGFGIAHRRGLPGGPLGMLGAGLFGLSQGMLRLRRRPLLELVCIHAVVDGIIFAVVWHSWTLLGRAYFGP